MKKSELVSYIEKYHLGGIVETVQWEITPEGQATIGFVATENSTAGKITFPFNNILGYKFGVASTSSLLKMLHVIGEDVDVGSTVQHGVPMSLDIRDEIYDAKFSLADIHNIPEVPEVIEPKGYDLESNLSKEFRDQYLKAYKALGSIDRITIEVPNGFDRIKFTLGNKESYANKMSWEMDGSNSLPLKPIAFSGEALAAILKVNDCNKATLSVSSQGLMKIKIDDNGSSVTYFIVELEDL